MIDASGEEEDNMTSDDNGQEARELAQQSNTIKKSNKGRKLTDEEIVAHAVTFILAGYETTANTLAYTSYLLALNPDIQEKLQSEIDTYFEDKPVSQITSCARTHAVDDWSTFALFCRKFLCMKQVRISPTWIISSKSRFVSTLLLQG